MITQQRLHELFEYREDGNLIWKIKIGKRIKVGDIAGAYDQGYTRISINYTRYPLHRLIFLYHHGYLTVGLQIDHIDGNSENNRIENLREVTQRQNNMNSKLKVTNTSGVKGVYWSKAQRKWHSRIKVNGKNTHLGYYDTLEEAESVVKDARKKYHGEYARHN